MKFIEIPLPGARLIEPERIWDDRGFFARTFCQRLFREAGLDPRVAQCSLSFNERKGTLRGMHYQRPPRSEAKLIRCTMGRAYDVILDLRPDSPTFRKWHAVELSAENRRMLYVPEGFAHGFQTLEDRTEMFYQTSVEHSPEDAAGVRWDDPAFAIAWPLDVACISERDRRCPDFRA